MHSLSTAVPNAQTSSRRLKNPLPNLVIHPAQPISEGNMDNALSALLRMMRLPEVLGTDMETAARMGGAQDSDIRTDDDIIHEMRAVRDEHDYRVERAVLAVQMLRDRYNWKRRVGDGTNDVEVPGNDPQFKPASETKGEEEGGEESDDDDDDDDDLEMVGGDRTLSQPPLNGASVTTNGNGAASDSDDFEMADADSGGVS